MMILPNQAFIKTCRRKAFIIAGGRVHRSKDAGDTAREPIFQGSLPKHCP
jgi:hypothetical protein